MDMNKSTLTERLKTIRKLNEEKPNFVNETLYKLLIREESLVAGYEKIKSNKGATTPAVDEISLDGFGQKRLSKLAQSLANESWQPLPARRIYIPKPGNEEKRPLGIQGPEEKIVQAVMLYILEAIYEPVFSPFSYGFRPKMGCHNALRMIGQNFDGMTFAIEGDIKGMYDNVNHHTLVGLIKKRVKDERFIRLLWKLLRAGYMWEGTKTVLEIGTPQGSIVSPILANIYLHELDLFLETLKSKVITRKNKIRTPIYKEIDNRMRKAKDRLRKNNPSGEERKSLLEQLRLDKMSSLKVRMYTKPSDRLVFARYADDFIIGIAGSKEYAESVREEIRIFLNTLGLTLNLEKTKVTNLRKDLALFLGHLIGIKTSVKHSYIHQKNRTPYLKRVTGSLVSIDAPIERIVSRLASKGFCDTKGFPKAKTPWINQEDEQIVKNFAVTIRDLFGFYSGVFHQHPLQRIWYILKFSCAFTLAARHRTSLRKIFTQHGRLLTVRYGLTGEKQVSLPIISFKNGSKKWQLGRQLPDPYRLIAGLSGLKNKNL